MVFEDIAAEKHEELGGSESECVQWAVLLERQCGRLEVCIEDPGHLNS